MEKAQFTVQLPGYNRKTNHNMHSGETSSVKLNRGIPSLEVKGLFSTDLSSISSGGHKLTPTGERSQINVNKHTADNSENSRSGLLRNKSTQISNSAVSNFVTKLDISIGEPGKGNSKEHYTCDRSVTISTHTEPGFRPVLNADTFADDFLVNDVTDIDVVCEFDAESDLILDHCSCCNEDILISEYSNNDCGVTDQESSHRKPEIDWTSEDQDSITHLEVNKSPQNLPLYSFSCGNENSETQKFVWNHSRSCRNKLQTVIEESFSPCYETSKTEHSFDQLHTITEDISDVDNDKINLNDNGGKKVTVEHNSKISCVTDKSEKSIGFQQRSLLFNTPREDFMLENKRDSSTIENSGRPHTRTDNQVTGKEGGPDQEGRNSPGNDLDSCELPAPDIITSNYTQMEAMTKYKHPDILNVSEPAKIQNHVGGTDKTQSITLNRDTQTKSHRHVSFSQTPDEQALAERSQLITRNITNDLIDTTAASSKNRILHVPIANKVIIPVTLKDPGCPATTGQQSRKIDTVGVKSDLDHLKEMAVKLKLTTRRPSYLLWRERLEMNRISCDKAQQQQQLESSEVKDKVSAESISSTLAWLRRELTEMRAQDQVLAGTLLKIRQEMRELKLEQSCAEHQEILADAMEIEEEKDILGELSCDYLSESFSPTLKHVGVTRMHIGTRRFSVF